MKVIFEFSKKLGTNPLGEPVEMYVSTASILQRKGFGEITKKVVYAAKPGAKTKKRQEVSLTAEDKKSFQLDKSLVKKAKEEKTE